MFDYLYGLFSNVEITWFFVGFTSFIFLVNLFATIFLIKGKKKNKTISIRNKKSNLFVYSVFIFILAFLCKKNIEFTIGIVSLLIAFDLILNFISLKVLHLYKFKKKDFSFYKTINKTLPSEKVVSAIKVKPIEKRENEENILNVSHIKGIINKLNCFSLLPQEKKQVNDLTVSIKKYEDGLKDFSTKSEINEGLNALLKIMARYSI